MRDWKMLVREKLAATGGQRPLSEDVVKELAQHLEDGYYGARARGMAESAAVEVAMRDVEDWRGLAEEIQRATTQENLVNKRTKTLWLPSLASFTAANLFLLALTQMSMQPQHLVRLNSGLAGRLYAVWLISNMLCGALGAFLSRRAGGNITARIVASMFPAIVLSGLWALVIPVSALVQNNAFVLRHPLYYAAGLFVWVVPPGIALLLGAAPFLKTSLEPRTASVE